MKREHLEKITSRGYWRVNFQPTTADQKLTLEKCKDTIHLNSVHLRGWDYPHFPQREGEDTGLELGDNFYEGWIDWNDHKEFWRMYQSGQFIHYLALREDWIERRSFIDAREKIKPMEKLNIIGSVIYQMTEIFEFLARLTNTGIYDRGVAVSISLNNTENRELWISEPMRGSFLKRYRTTLKKIEFAGNFTKEQMLSSAKETALEAMKYFFDRFGWHNPSPEQLKKDQESLLRGRQ